MKKEKAGIPKDDQNRLSNRKEKKRNFKSATVDALKSIIAISNDKYNKNRLNACKYIIDKAYGSDTAFLVEDEDEQQIIIEVRTRGNEDD